MRQQALSWQEKLLHVTAAERRDVTNRLYWRRIARGWRRFWLLLAERDAAPVREGSSGNAPTDAGE